MSIFKNTIPPDAEAKKVFTTTEPISSQFPTAPSVEPGLNPNHPNHFAPIDAKGKLCLQESYGGSLF